MQTLKSAYQEDLLAYLPKEEGQRSAPAQPETVRRATGTHLPAAEGSPVVGSPAGGSPAEGSPVADIPAVDRQLRPRRVGGSPARLAPDDPV